MKATYHQEAPNKPCRLDVLRTNKDGTVDLGYGTDKEGTLVVGSCPVSDQPKTGHAVLDKADDKKAEKKADKTEADDKKAEKKADKTEADESSGEGSKKKAAKE